MRFDAQTKLRTQQRAKEQAEQHAYEVMKREFQKHWDALGIHISNPTHCLRQLSERMMVSRAVDQEVSHVLTAICVLALALP